MRRNCLLAGAVVVCLLCGSGLQAQQSDSSVSNGTSASDNANMSPFSPPAAGAVPRLIKFAGTAKDLTSKVSTGVVGLTFSLYELPEGGSPLWTEAQSLTLDSLGHYTALLGANSSEGLPLDLFTSSKALWLGVQAQLPGQTEQPRVLLVAVPYALKSSDADTLGGLPASAYMLAPSENAGAGSSATSTIAFPPPSPVQPPGTPSPSGSISGAGTLNFAAMFTGSRTIGNSGIFSSPSGWVGIGTTNPTATLHVYGAGTFAGTVGQLGTIINNIPTGVYGFSSTGSGVIGSGGPTGVYGSGGTYGVYGTTTTPNSNGVYGISTGANSGAVYGYVSGMGSAGVIGNSATGQSGYGVYATGDTGVYGSSTLTNGNAIYGYSPASGGAGVLGVSAPGQNGYGVIGKGDTGSYGFSASMNGYGVHGVASGTNAYGVLGSSPMYGVAGNGTGTGGTGVWGYSAPGNNGNGVLAQGDEAVYAMSSAANGIGVNAVSNAGTNGMGVRASGDTPLAAFDNNDGMAQLGGSVFGTPVGVYGESNQIGVWGTTSAGGGVGVSASATGTLGTGVYASGTYYGVNSTSTGPYGVASNDSGGGGGTAFFGYSSGTGAVGLSVASAPGTGGYGMKVSGDTGAMINGSTSAGGYGLESSAYTVGVYGQAVSIGVEGSSPGTAVMSQGNLSVLGSETVSGTKSAVVALQDDSVVALYAVESPENWFEDFGSGELKGGAAEVSLDPAFAQTVTPQAGYHVFLTPNGDCRGLYVAQKTATGFVVRELGGGNSNVAFDYRVIVKRKGLEALRMEQVSSDRTAADSIRQLVAERPSRPPRYIIPPQPAETEIPPVPEPAPIIVPHIPGPAGAIRQPPRHVEPTGPPEPPPGGAGPAERVVGGPLPGAPVGAIPKPAQFPTPPRHPAPPQN